MLKCAQFSTVHRLTGSSCESSISAAERLDMSPQVSLWTLTVCLDPASQNQKNTLTDGPEVQL